MKKQILHGKLKKVADAIQIALRSARNLKQKIKPTRIVTVPKIIGILLLIPIFSELSALGTISGGTAAKIKTVNDANAAKQQLEEATRHNQKMESTAIGSKGLYLKPYKTGVGLFSQPPPKNYSILCHNIHFPT